MWYKEEIKKAGQKLARIDPNAPELKSARDWWVNGTQYSNHDFDILSMLNNAIWRLEK